MRTFVSFLAIAIALPALALGTYLIHYWYRYNLLCFSHVFSLCFRLSQQQVFLFFCFLFFPSLISLIFCLFLLSFFPLQLEPESPCFRPPPLKIAFAGNPAHESRPALELAALNDAIAALKALDSTDCQLGIGGAKTYLSRAVANLRMVEARFIKGEEK
jgi:hypothetical protein